MTLVLAIGLTWLVAAVLILGVMAAAGRSGHRADEESATAAQRILEPMGELRLAVSNQRIAERGAKALCPACASLVVGAMEGDPCPACGTAVSELPRIRPVAPVPAAGADEAAARPHRVG